MIEPREIVPEIPDDVVFASAMCVVSYFDGEGDLRYAVKAQGEVPLSTQLGLLELAKFSLWQDVQDGD